MRSTAALALPLVVGHVSTGLIAFADNLIAGHHGTLTLASVTIGTALLWLPMLVPIGTLIALTAAVAQLCGAGRHGEVGAVFRQATWLALVLGLAMFVFLSTMAKALPLLGIAPEVIPGATAFLLAVRWGGPALTLFYCFRYLCEGTHWTRPTMVFGFGGLFLLVPLGWALTNGRLGLPALGAQGLGIASATMMWAQALTFAVYLWRSPRFAPLRLFERAEGPQWSVISGLLKAGLPIGLSILMQGGLFIATALLIGRLGAQTLAAHQIAVNVSQLCFMIPVAVAEATTVRVGHALGAGHGPVQVRLAARAGYVIVLATQLCAVLVLLIARDEVAGLYTADAGVALLASTLLVYTAVLQVPDGLQMVSSGVLRGLNDTRVPMLMAVGCYWGIGMPLGAGLGLGLGMGAPGMWTGLITALVAAAFVMAWRVRRSAAAIPVH
ncbi:MATE family efflux transporter [Stenotrophomonas sp. SAM-B]|nr:MATE family efflux transporter [Stenotrophomonas sp. SAM-B]